MCTSSPPAAVHVEVCVFPDVALLSYNRTKIQESAVVELLRVFIFTITMHGDSRMDKPLFVKEFVTNI
jgi:hypothetical protein